MKKCQFAVPLKINSSASPVSTVHAGSLDAPRLDSPLDTTQKAAAAHVPPDPAVDISADTPHDSSTLSKPHYAVPEWSGPPSSDMFLEVLRGGVQAGRIDFVPDKQFLYIGRCSKSLSGF